MRQTRSARIVTALAAALLALLCACAARRDLPVELARAGGFVAQRHETSAFVLHGWLRPARNPGVDTLCVYIEGDGLAYLRPGRPSDDPTPTDPVALRLALADSWPGPVLYLARPCQYVQGGVARGCGVADWTTGRFSVRAVQALDEAVSRAKAATGARRVALHGYSGGGAMAALLAEGRPDVTFLATVAGNLDHALWTRLHGDAPLSGSLNPVDRAEATRALPQLHVLGGSDTVISSALLDSWSARLPGARLTRVVLPGVGHAGPWESAWPELLRRHRPLNAPQAPLATQNIEDRP